MKRFKLKIEHPEDYSVLLLKDAIKEVESHIVEEGITEHWGFLQRGYWLVSVKSQKDKASIWVRRVQEVKENAP